MRTLAARAIPAYCASAMSAEIAFPDSAAKARAGKSVTKSIGVVTALTSGDVACYVSVKRGTGAASEEMADRSGREKLNSAISGNSGHNAGP